MILIILIIDSKASNDPSTRLDTHTPLIIPSKLTNGNWVVTSLDLSTKLTNTSSLISVITTLVVLQQNH